MQLYYLSILFPGQLEDKLPKGNELTELARSICSAGNLSQIDMEISVLRLLVYDSFPIKWNMIKNMNLEICPENISHLQNDKNNSQANCLNINESGYELTSRDPAFTDDASNVHPILSHPAFAATLFIYIKIIYIIKNRF